MLDNEVIEVVQRLREVYDLPGVQCAISLGGEPISICSGLAAPSFSLPVTPVTRFHLGSVGKHISATALMALARPGGIDLDAPVAIWVPALPEKWRSLTLRALLTHTAGLPDYIAHVAPDAGVANAQVYTQIADLEPLFASGHAWSYSNTGFRILQDVLDAVAPGGFRGALETLFTRAKLTEMVIDDSGALHPRAEPCMFADGQLQRATLFYAINVGSGDGGIAASAAELVRWAQALWSGRIVDANALATLTAPAVLQTGRRFPYGMGLWLDRAATGARHVWHSGAMPGFASCLLIWPDIPLYVAVSTNVLNTTVATRHIGLAVAEKLRPGLTFVSAPSIPDAPVDTEELLDIVLQRSESIRVGNWAEELVFARRGPHLVDFSHMGLPERSDAVERGIDDAGSFVRYRLHWGERIEFVTVAHCQDGRIWRVARS